VVEFLSSALIRFFADIDWQALLDKKYVAPWIPPKSAADGSCFDTTYTQQPVLNSVTNPSQLAQSHIPDFAGFSWNAPGAYPENSPPSSSAYSMNRLPVGSPPPGNYVGDDFDEGILEVRDRVEDSDHDVDDSEDETNGFVQVSLQSTQNRGEDGLLFDIEMDEQNNGAASELTKHFLRPTLPPTPLRNKGSSRW